LQFLQAKLSPRAFKQLARVQVAGEQMPESLRTILPEAKAVNPLTRKKLFIEDDAGAVSTRGTERVVSLDQRRTRAPKKKDPASAISEGSLHTKSSSLMERLAAVDIEEEEPGPVAKPKAPGLKGAKEKVEKPKAGPLSWRRK